MKKKGFTLIELLAVIVILAIIALVAIPTLLKVVDKAKQGADKASALGYIDAVEKYAMICNLKQPENCLEANTKYYVNEASNDEVSYSFMDKIIDRVKAETKIGSIYLEDVINVKGDEPASGYVILDSKSKVIEAEFKMKTYEVSCDDKKCSVTGKVGKQIVTKLEITNKENKLYTAKTLQLNYDIEASEEVPVTWKSSDTSIATVDSNGLVTGVSEGNVTITVKAGKKRSTINLNIEKLIVCTYKSGNNLNVSSLYECDPGDGIKRNFYVLNVNDNDVEFIMDRNITTYGESLYQTNYNTAMNYFNTQAGINIKNTWIDVKDVDFPSAEHIAIAVGNTNWKVAEKDKNGGFYLYTGSSSSIGDKTKTSWLINNLRGCSAYGCSVNGNDYTAYGYWTKDKPIDSSGYPAWGVNYDNRLSAINSGGVRLVITVSKENIE